MYNIPPMTDQIVCPHCKNTIPLTQALSHQIQERYQKIYQQRLQEEKEKITKVLQHDLAQKMREEIGMELKDKANEVTELTKQKQALQEQLLQLNKLLRELRTDNEKRQLELEKKLTEEQEKIRHEERMRLDETYKLKLLEKEKQIDDARKIVEEYKRKLEQGSQQLQGEVLELALEQILIREFPTDEIQNVAKGVRGADLIHIVRDRYGHECGKILWESKRTRAWSNEWIGKLKEDQRIVKAEIAVLISQTLPSGKKLFWQEQNVWVGSFESIVGIASVLRALLVETAAVKHVNTDRKEKMEILYNYLSGIEFRQRIEAVIEAFSAMREDLEKEKRWFTLKWAKEDKHIRNVIDNVVGMRGDLQGIMGKALPEMKGLQLLPDESGDEPTLF